MRRAKCSRDGFSLDGGRVPQWYVFIMDCYCFIVLKIPHVIGHFLLKTNTLPGILPSSSLWTSPFRKKRKYNFTNKKRKRIPVGLETYTDWSYKLVMTSKQQDLINNFLHSAKWRYNIVMSMDIKAANKNFKIFLVNIQNLYNNWAIFVFFMLYLSPLLRWNEIYIILE